MRYFVRLFPQCLLLLIGLSACNPSEHRLLQVTVNSPELALDTGLKSVSGFDVYADQQRLHALFTMTERDPRQARLVYAHSDDAGHSWSAPQLIELDAGLSMESVQGNDAQLAAWGERLLVVWQRSGEIPGMGPLQAAVSQDGGRHWQLGRNPTASEIDQSHADLLADQQGRFHLVWLDDRDEKGYQGLRYARSDDGGEQWPLALTIDDSSCSCCWNRMYLNSHGALGVLYRDMEFRDMALAQSSDGGEHWQRLSTAGAFHWKFDGCPHNGGGLTQANGGRLHAVVWTGVENRAGLYHVFSETQGREWSEPQAIAPGTGAFHADIAALDERHVLMVWDAMGADGTTIWMADSADDGRSWSSPVMLSTLGRQASHPRVLATQSGWVVMWSEKQTDGSKRWLSAVVE